MKLKKNIWVLIFLIFIAVAFSQTTQQRMTNGLSILNMSFNGTNTFNVSISVPANAQLLNGSFLITNFHTLTNCTVEFANETKDCPAPFDDYNNNGTGGSNGSYISFPGANTYKEWIDGDYTTSNAPGLAGQKMHVNYTIPPGSGYTNLTWVFAAQSPALIIHNLSFNKSCIDFFRNNISKVMVEVFSNDGPPDFVRAACYNGTDWVNMFDNDNTGKQFYEEALIIHYGVKNTTAQINMSDITDLRLNYTNFTRVDYTNAYNEILGNGCNCTGCSSGEGQCSVPFTFDWNTTGLIEISDINATFLYNYSILLIDEINGTPADISRFHQVKWFNDDNSSVVDLTELGVNNVTFFSEPGEKRRLEITYPDGSIINRYFDMELINTTQFRVCANNESDVANHFEQLIVSSRERRLVMESVFARCLVAADYTRFGEATENSLQAFTIERPYNMFVWVNGVKTVLAGFTGGTSRTINIDTLEFDRREYDFSILSDAISFQKEADNPDQIKILYNNIKNNNAGINVTIIDMNTSAQLFASSEFTNPNQFVIFFNFATMNVSDRTLWRIRVDKAVIGQDDPGSIQRYFGPNGKSGLFDAKFAAVVAFFMLMFGLTFTSVKTTFSWFGLIIELSTVFWLSLSIQTWYIVFMQAMAVCFMVYTALVMWQKNLPTIA